MFWTKNTFLLKGPPTGTKGRCCPGPIRKKHTDRVFLSSACESLDQGCVSFKVLWAVGSALPWPLREPHDPIYRPPLGHVRHSLYTQIIRIPCMHPTVHLICGHSWATVGLHAGETVCFGESVTKTFHFSNSISHIERNKIQIERMLLNWRWSRSHPRVGPWGIKLFLRVFPLLIYCAVTMDNLHHLTGCLGQSSLRCLGQSSCRNYNDIVVERKSSLFLRLCPLLIAP